MNLDVFILKHRLELICQMEFVSACSALNHLLCEELEFNWEDADLLICLYKQAPLELTAERILLTHIVFQGRKDEDTV